MSSQNINRTCHDEQECEDENDTTHWLEEQKRWWTTEQERIASLVQVYRDPTTITTTTSDASTPFTTKQQQQQQPHYSNKNASAAAVVVVVKDLPWCKVVRLSIDIENEKDLDSSPVPDNNRYYFGGVDIGFPIISNTAQAAVAVYVVIDARTMQIVYRDHVWIPVSELPPYISTFLAFREIGPLEKLVHKQIASAPHWTPSAILVDGNGIFHPRQAGLACFLGVRTGIPTIGIGELITWHDMVEVCVSIVK